MALFRRARSVHRRHQISQLPGSKTAWFARPARRALSLFGNHSRRATLTTWSTCWNSTVFSWWKGIIVADHRFMYTGCVIFLYTGSQIALAFTGRWHMDTG